MKFTLKIFIFNLFIFTVLFAQSDSVNVTFYYAPIAYPAFVYLPGEFNNWGNNQAGQIVDPKFAMIFNAQTEQWEKTIRLHIGGPDPTGGIPGAYQYKFNENGNEWLPDPLNPRQNSFDNNNSYLYIQDPTIHYLLPNSLSGLVKNRFPNISAYIFPSVESSIDTGSIQVILDDITYHHLGSYYDPRLHQFLFPLPDPLASGSHVLKLKASTNLNKTNSDSTAFIVQAGIVQILTQSDDHCLRSSKTIAGLVEDASVTQAILNHTISVNASAKK